MTQECLLNAGYTISVARKLGATVFLLPEDIYEVGWTFRLYYTQPFC